MKEIIISGRDSKGIILPSREDYVVWGLPIPTNLLQIESPTMQEIKEYSGADLSLGIPLIKCGFFGEKKSALYAPTIEDMANLGIKRNIIVNTDGTIQRSSYQIVGDMAYIQDPHGSLVEEISRNPQIINQVNSRGALRLRFFKLPIEEIRLFHPGAEELSKNRGKKTVLARFPDYLLLKENTPKGSIRGTSSNGIEYSLS